MTPSKIHNTLLFNGIDDFVTLPRASSLKLNNRSFTAQAWIKPTGLTALDHSIIGNDVLETNRGLHLVIRNKKAYLGFANNDLGGTITLQDNKWYHITWRYDKALSEQAIFINGELDVKANGHPPFTGTGIVRMGRSAGGRYFKGTISELIIWEKALSAEYIKANYTNQPKGPETGLTAYWSINDGPGSFSIKCSNNESFGGKLPNAFHWSTETGLPFRKDPDAKNNLLNFDEDARVKLPKANALDLPGNSFTIQIWVKPTALTPEDQSILGTATPAINQGLHLLIRDRKAYMAFSDNHTGAVTTLTNNVWYQITWRYDKVSGEKAIFVNGDLDGSSLPHPPFIGTDPVNIGRCTVARNFRGAIGDVKIWGMPLSNASIKDSYASKSGSIVGIGTNNQLYTRETINSVWVNVPNSGSVIGLALMKNGTIIGIGTDNQLWTRRTLTSDWINVPNSGSVKDIVVLDDGSLLGTGTNNQLYTRQTLNSNWVNVPNSGSVIGITVLSDDTILGIGTNYQLYKRETLNSNWVNVPNSGSVIGITTLSGDTIIGIGTNYQLYKRETLDSNWVHVPNSGSVIGIAVALPVIQHTAPTLGVGTDNQLYVRSELGSNWVGIPNSGSLLDVVRLADGTVVGVGTDNQLWTRKTINSNWVNVPNSGSVIGVTVMGDGTILGIGTNNQLYTKQTLNSTWVNVPDSGSVIGVTIMNDGTILGIGTNNQLYTKQTLNSTWVNVSNSGSVIGVTVMGDGTILGIGTDNQLWKRRSLTSSWINVPNSGSVIALTKTLTLDIQQEPNVHWALDEGEGSKIALSKANSALNGQLEFERGPYWQTESNVPFRKSPDKNSNFLQFGPDTYVTLARANELGITQMSFTAQAWIKADAFIAQDQAIFGTDSSAVNYGLQLIIRNKIPYMGFLGNDIAGKTTLETNRWYHITWRYDLEKQEQAIYLDGNEECSATGRSPFLATMNVNLGRITGSSCFNGLICEVAFWDTPLTQDRIRATRKQRPLGSEHDLTAYFPLDEGKGTIAKELNFNSVAGTIHNGTWISNDELFFRPTQNATGQKSLLLAKAKEIANQNIAAAKAKGHEQLAKAKTTANKKVVAAHREATTQMNNTKFEYIYFISGDMLKKVNPAGKIENFYSLDPSTKQEVIIEARDRWEYPSIMIESTQNARIVFKSGQWSPDISLGTTDANGISGTQAGSRSPMPLEQHGALIGNIGGTVFLLGNDGRVPEGLSGELVLGINKQRLISIRPPVRPIMRHGRSLIAVPIEAFPLQGPYGEILVEVELTTKSPNTPPVVIASDVVVDPVAQKVYLARHSAPFQLNEINLNGTGFRTIYAGAGPITSLTMDLVSKKIYFIEGNGSIKHINADGSDVAQLIDISAPHKDGFWRIDLDKANNKLYWTNENSIWRASTDGSNPELVLGHNDAPYPVDIAVDGPGKKCYWVDKEIKHVMRANTEARHAAFFNGVDAYIEINDPFENDEHFTICCWINPAIINETTYYPGFIGKQGDAYRKPSLWMTNSNSGIHYDSYHPDGTRFYGVIPNFFDDKDVWVHIAWIKEGTEYRLYKNGKLFKTMEAPEKFYKANSTYWIGKVDWPFTGSIAEVQFWSRPISEEEIKQYMPGSIKGRPQGLTDYLPLNDSSGTQTSNLINTNNNGRLINATWSQSDNLKLTNVQMLYPCPIPHAGLALDTEDGTLRQIYWTATEEDGKHFMMRGSMDGSEPAERLFEIPCQGGIALLTKGMVEHEQRILAYKKRKEAKEKAAKDLANAHTEANARQQTAHANYGAKQKEAQKSVADAQTKANADKIVAKKQLNQSQVSAKGKVDHAKQSASQKRKDAHNKAKELKDNATIEANRVKNNAQSKLNSARQQRSKY